MPHDRFYSPDLETLSKKELHHLQAVMKKQKGDSIEVVDGKGTLAKAKVQGSTFQISSKTTEKSPPPGPILVQGLAHPQKLELIIEKGTELGATAFWLFPGDKGEKQNLTPNQNDRLQAKAISALKQSGRLFLPEIKLLPPLCEWNSLPHPTFYGDLSPEAPFYKPPQKAPYLMVIGPESGLSQEELSWLQKKGATGVRLSHYTLRTETAAIAAIVLSLVTLE